MIKVRIYKNNILHNCADTYNYDEAERYIFWEYEYHLTGNKSVKLYNTPKEIKEKLNMLNFVHVWDIVTKEGDLIKCEMFKK